MPKIRPRKRNAWELLRETTRGAVEMGYRRAYKHTDTPSEDHIFDTIEQYVVNALAEEFDIEDK